jgi:hypothetical protein
METESHFESSLEDVKYYVEKIKSLRSAHMAFSELYKAVSDYNRLLLISETKPISKWSKEDFEELWSKKFNK